MTVYVGAQTETLVLSEAGCHVHAHVTTWIRSGMWGVEARSRTAFTFNLEPLPRPSWSRFHCAAFVPLSHGCSTKTREQGDRWSESATTCTVSHAPDNDPRIDCKNDKVSHITLELVDESPFHLKGTFPGPEETPYEGGIFDVVRLISSSFSVRVMLTIPGSISSLCLP
jgi:hypothetical protein